MKQAGFGGYSWAFGVPGVLMALATLIFWLGTKHYVRRPPANETRTAGFFKVFLEAFRQSHKAPTDVRAASVISVLTSAVLPILATLGMLTVALYDIFSKTTPPVVLWIGWAAVSILALWFVLLLVASIWFRSELPQTFWAGARGRFSEPEIAAARSVAPILAVFSFIIPFWTLWDQSLSTWVMQGEQMKAFKFLGLNVGAEQMQSLNAILVLILLPIMTLGLYPLLEKLGLRVTPLRRMSSGMILMMFCFVLVALYQRQLEHGTQLSLAVQAWPYLILTIAEVLVSTTGLEFAYTQAAASMKSAIMGFFLLTTALGNLLIVTVTKLGSGHGDESVSSGRFYFYAAMMAVVGVLFTIVAARYRYRDEPEVQSKN